MFHYERLRVSLEVERVPHDHLFARCAIFLPHFDTVIFWLSLNLDLTNSCCILGGCVLLRMNSSRCKIVVILGLPFGSSIPIFRFHF